MSIVSTFALLLVTALVVGCSNAPRPRNESRQAVTVVADPDDEVLSGPGLPARGRACHTVIKSGFYSYSSLAAVRNASCTTTIRTFTALFEQMLSRSHAGEDCYPGFCTMNSPMTTHGFRCTALGLGEGIARLTCRRGPQIIDAATVWGG